MRFTYLDFYLLSSDLEGTLPEALVSSEAAVIMPFIPQGCVLEHSISKLISEGFLEHRENRLIHTQKAKDFFNDKKFLEGKKKRMHRLMRKLCECSATLGDFSFGEGEFEKTESMLRSMYTIHPAVMLCNDQLTIKSYAVNDDDGDGGGLDEYTFALANTLTLAHDLLTVAAQMCEPTKARKICVDTPDTSFVLTLFDEGDAIRIKAQKIFFNRKRFSGKLNSNLDYAQCGDVLLDVKCSKTEFFESVALIALHSEDSFTDSDYQNLNLITL